MNKITFVDGTKTQEAYITVNGQNYTVTPAVWSGTTPVSALNLNNMQNNIENAINEVNTKYEEQTTIKRIRYKNIVSSANENINISIKYKVGNDSLEVFYCGTKLIKGEDYNEVGTTGSISNIIQLTDSIGDLDMSYIEGFEDFEETLEFIVRGDYDVD